MSNHIARAALAALITTTAISCSDSDPTPTPDAGPEITLSSIEILSATLMVVEGDEVRFSAIGTYSDDTTKNVTTEAIWRSSDPDVATVGPTGLCITKTAGTVTIEAELDEVKSTVTLTVLRSPVRSIAVTPTTVELLTTETQQLTAIATLTDNSTEDVTGSATWASSDESVATVSAAGLVTAVTAGEATVTARDASTGITSTPTLITVRDPAPTAIVVQPTPVTLEINETQALTASLWFEDGSNIDVTDQVVWSSNDEDVAEVSNAAGTEGTVTARGSGQAGITATHEATGFNDTARITVNVPTLSSLRVTPGTVTLQLRQRQVFVATAVYSDGSERPVTGGVTWVSSNPAVVNVSNEPGTTGQAQALGVGNVTISCLNEQTGLSSDDSGQSATVTVPQPTRTSVIVLPGTANVAAGLSQQYQAFEVFSDNTGNEITTTATWSSSDPNIATVDANGLVTTLAEGNVTIIATEPNSGISSNDSQTSGALTVDPPILISVSITPPAAAMVIGSSQQFTATGNYSDSVTRDITNLVEWSSSGSGVTITSGGLATAQSLGNFTVSATEPESGISSDASGQSATVLVSAAQLLSIAVTPATNSLPVGATAPLIATGTYDNNSTVDLTSIVTWSSSDPAIASVSNANGAQGVATAVAQGAVTISAVEPASGVSSATTNESAAITVPAGVTVQSIAVTPASQTIRIGQSHPYQATGTFSDNSTHPMTESVTWSSSAGSVASVSNAEGSRGLVTALAVGSSVISAQHVGSGVSSTTNGIAMIEQGIETADIYHFELDEGSGTVATNSAPGGNNGSIVGTSSWVTPGGAPGTSAACLQMAASSTNHILPSPDTVTATNLTIDFWWQWVSGNATSLSYVYNSGISFRAFTGGVANTGMYVRATPGGSDIVVSTNVQTGAWHHFAYVLDAAAGTGTFYINGAVAGTTSYSGSINITSFRLAGQGSTNGQTVNYDRYRVWSTAASATEVMDMFMGNR